MFGTPRVPHDPPRYYPLAANISQSARRNDVRMYASLQDPQGVAMTWGIQAIVSLDIGDLQSAARYFKTGYEVSEQGHEPSSAVPACLMTTAVMFDVQPRALPTCRCSLGHPFLRGMRVSFGDRAAALPRLP